MKKFLLMFFMFIGFAVTSNAQSIQWYQATNFACNVINGYGNWTGWSDWEQL